MLNRYKRNTVLMLLLIVLQTTTSDINQTSSARHVTNFRGYKVLRIFPKNPQDLRCVLTIESHVRNVDFWSEPRTIGQTVDIMVPPGQFTQTINYLNDRKIHFDILIEDVQRLLNMQKVVEVPQQLNRRIFSLFSFAKFNPTPTLSMSWTRYHRLNTIYNYMTRVAEKFPDVAKVITIGKTYEGRQIQVIKMGRQTNKWKPAIWIDGGIHAREWISPATVTFMIEQLVIASLQGSSKYLDEMDWYFLPVANPDGYEYTHTSSRMWRKNRAVTSNLFCRGVDLNRNFGHFWNVGGSSNRPCAEDYAGPSAKSELETKAMTQFISSHNTTIKMYITTHSYGQLWLTPWGYTSKIPNDYEELHQLATRGAQAIKSVYGTTYTIGTSTNVLYIASGGSDDWAKGAAGIKYSYTLELRDRGRYGFLLPPNQINQTARETWEGIKALADFLTSVKY
ncbi:corticosteroid- binding protein [Chamberlinius hualienensis]